MHTHKKTGRKKGIAVSAPARVLVNYRELRVLFWFFLPECWARKTKASMAVCEFWIPPSSPLSAVKERRDAVTPWRPLGAPLWPSATESWHRRVSYLTASPTTGSPEASWENWSCVPTDGRKWAGVPFSFLDLGIQQRFLITWESIQHLVGIKPSAGLGCFWKTNIFINVISICWYTLWWTKWEFIFALFAKLHLLSHLWTSPGRLERDSLRFLLQGAHFPGMFPWRRYKRIDTQRKKVWWNLLNLHKIPNIAFNLSVKKNFFSTLLKPQKAPPPCILNNQTSCLSQRNDMLTSRQRNMQV